MAISKLTIKTIITRLIFALHASYFIWKVIKIKKDYLYFWYLSGPVLLLFFEGIFTLVKTKNHQLKWFCPSVFLYLSCVVPIVWLIKQQTIQSQLKCDAFKSSNSTVYLKLRNMINDKVKREYLKNSNVNISLHDLKLCSWLPKYTVLEQSLMLILIIGRWMLPKGHLTRDQLSQVLLVYIGIAADIIEIFDCFHHDIENQNELLYCTLGIWTWSLMQFTIVPTAIKVKKSQVSPSSSASKKRAHRGSNCCNEDICEITLSLILQDGPFLIFRVILVFGYGGIYLMNIFFMFKNTLVIMLQLYRLCIVFVKSKKKRTKRFSEVDVKNINNISQYVLCESVRIKSLRENNENRHKSI